VVRDARSAASAWQPDPDFDQDLTLAERRSVADRLDARRERAARTAAWQEWIPSLYWDWFATFTWDPKRYPELRLEFAQRCVFRFLTRLSREVYGRRFAKRGMGLYGVITFERQKNGRWHAHGVIGGTRRLRRLTTMDSWNASYGFARIYPVSDEQLKSVVYAVKYAVKGPEPLIFGTWRNVQPSLWKRVSG
jgi:hypothetical protein